jgi:hypothetical protein
MNALHILALVITVPVSALFFLGGAALSVIDWDGPGAGDQ